MTLEEIKTKVCSEERLVMVVVDGKTHIVDVRDQSGNPLPYDGWTRRAALKEIIGREPLPEEEIGTTFLFSPDVTVLLK